MLARKIVLNEKKLQVFRINLFVTSCQRVSCSGIIYKKAERELTSLIRLLKKGEKEWGFWEAWYEEKEAQYAVHVGTVGVKGGQYSVLADQPAGNNLLALQEWINEMKEEGYVEVTKEDLQPLHVQFFHLNAEDVETRYRIEQILDECLGTTGNGHCDGGDDSRGGLVFICRVLQIDQAVVDVRQALRETSFFEGVCMFTFHADNSCIILT